MSRSWNITQMGSRAVEMSRRYDIAPKKKGAQMVLTRPIRLFYFLTSNYNLSTNPIKKFAIYYFKLLFSGKIFIN